MKRLVFTLATVALLGWVTPVQAGPITYQMSSTASGKIGAISFADALVTLTGTGDTANIVPISGFAAFAEPLTTTVTIQGVGTATITDPTEILSTVISLVPTTGFPDLPYVLFGRTDLPPALDSITGIGAVGNTALLGYNLSTSIGPITTTPGGIGFNPLCGTSGHDPCLGTTLGTLSFTSQISSTSQGTFTATTAPVPEPASLMLIGTGIITLVGGRFRRRRSTLKLSQ
jgi:hypothetical protein